MILLDMEFNKCGARKLKKSNKLQVLQLIGKGNAILLSVMLIKEASKLQIIVSLTQFNDRQDYHDQKSSPQMTTTATPITT